MNADRRPSGTTPLLLGAAALAGVLLIIGAATAGDVTLTLVGAILAVVVVADILWSAKIDPRLKRRR